MLRAVDELHRVGRDARRGEAVADRAAASSRLDSSASLPPRRMTALPDFRHSAAASTVTLGRDS